MIKDDPINNILPDNAKQAKNQQKKDAKDANNDLLNAMLADATSKSMKKISKKAINNIDFNSVIIELISENINIPETTKQSLNKQLKDYNLNSALQKYVRKEIKKYIKTNIKTKNENKKKQGNQVGTGFFNYIRMRKDEIQLEIEKELINYSTSDKEIGEYLKASTLSDKRKDLLEFLVLKFKNKYIAPSLTLQKPSLIPKLILNKDLSKWAAEDWGILTDDEKLYYQAQNKKKDEKENKKNIQNKTDKLLKMAKANKNA